MVGERHVDQEYLVYKLLSEIISEIRCESKGLRIDLQGLS